MDTLLGSRLREARIRKLFAEQRILEADPHMRVVYQKVVDAQSDRIVALEARLK